MMILGAIVIPDIKLLGNGMVSYVEGGQDRRL